jgi:hypothetical protein
MTWRAYTADNGTEYSVKVDESNAAAETVGSNSVPIMLVRTANAPMLPKGLNMRYVNTYNADIPRQKRKFWIGDPTAVSEILLVGASLTATRYPAGAGDNAGVESTWIITSYRGERSTQPPAFDAPDTGLTDASPDQ